MSPRTRPGASLTDRTYWWRLLAPVHPDRTGADGELMQGRAPA